MDKKIIIKGICIVLVIVLCSILFIANIDIFKTTISRINEILDISNVKNWFVNYSELNNNIIDKVISDTTSKVEAVKEIVNNNIDYKELFLRLLTKLIIFLIDFLNYFVNIGLNILLIMILFLNETFNGTNTNVKYSKPALIWLKLQQKVTYIKTKLKSLVRAFGGLLREYKQHILLILLLILMSNGFLFKIGTEIVIFLITYIREAINFETYLIFESIGKVLIILIYPFINSLNITIIILLILFIVYIDAFKRANFKLAKNHERLKVFVSDKLTQTTFINGAPGVGKTLVNVSLSLASEENIIEKLEAKMRSYQNKHPYINFAEIRKDIYNKEHDEYLELYEYLQNRSSYLISNFSIYSPYFNEYSKIFNFNFMRKNIKTDVYALEEHTIISISELDKEYNSHDDMKAVGQDGAATFFSTVSHDLKRTVKIFCDYQLKDQVPLRIRGNAEYFLTIKDRKKKYPILLYLYYLPIIKLDKLVSKLIIKYETKRTTINKHTKRKTMSKFKRNDYTLVYGILRKFQFNLNKVKKFFDQYRYFKMTAILSQEDGGKGVQVNFNLNLCDLKLEDQQLYDSTFLSYAYEEKKNTAFKDLPVFTSLTPSIEELSACNSRFFNKINNVVFEPKIDNPKKEETSIDEFIEV